jgi:hypothetical protein
MAALGRRPAIGRSGVHDPDAHRRLSDLASAWTAKALGMAVPAHRAHQHHGALLLIRAARSQMDVTSRCVPVTAR